MRYEHIELDLTREACEALLSILTPVIAPERSDAVSIEVCNFANELRARLQRTAIDLDWLES